MFLPDSPFCPDLIRLAVPASWSPPRVRCKKSGLIVANSLGFRRCATFAADAVDGASPLSHPRRRRPNPARASVFRPTRGGGGTTSPDAHCFHAHEPARIRDGRERPAPTGVQRRGGGAGVGRTAGFGHGVRIQPWCGGGGLNSHWVPTLIYGAVLWLWRVAVAGLL